MGVSHLLTFTGSSTPLFTSLSNSASTLGLMAFCTCLAFRYFGEHPGLTVSFIVLSLMLPNSPSNISECFFKISCRRPMLTSFTVNTSGQFNLSFLSHRCPNKGSHPDY
ncbi:hypothetical protein XENOCAPTIV_012375 [Xenoophorus captivus]|uniref:Uncharacterized protein n=1 Tax=Xenoophorus captivus TaxID=1517983 RepID=A0ABV0QRG9_9TELE